MASLWLPAPTRTAPTGPLTSTAAPLQSTSSNALTVSQSNRAQPAQSNTVLKRAPSYVERCDAALKWRSMTGDERTNSKAPFVPRSIKDFDDGGAFPEIHVAQYPLHMGNPHLKKRHMVKEEDNEKKHNRGVVSGLVQSTALVNVEVDENGEISYDAIVKQGTNADQKVYTKHSDLKGGEADPNAIKLPSAEEEAESTLKTNAALQNLINQKTALAKPTGSAIVNAQTSQNQEAKTQFISYTPNPEAPGYNPAAKQRIIQMVPAQLDPMMPPKHQHKKAPRGPADDFIPVLHAPPTKLSKEERAKWNIPACISNWKNTRGYTIPLDKRLAADGRGLRETTTINPNFATVSESLYVAERQARDEVKMRAKVQKQLVISEKEKREQELRDLANQARLERHNATKKRAEPDYDDHTDERSNIIPADVDTDADEHPHAHAHAHPQRGEQDENYEDVSAAAQRDRLRIARRKERERELRLEKSNKKQRLEEDRDVSEKIALGVHTGASASNQVDSRLYNQSAGLSSGFGAEDEYNTYTKPLFDRDAIAKTIYKPSSGENGIDADEEYEQLKSVGTKKFQPDRGFDGAEGGGATSGAGPRNAPVQFERGAN